METDLDRTVEAICRLPADRRKAARVTVDELITRSGYLQYRNQVTAEQTERVLREHPDWVDDWCLLSEDQRSSPNWWIADRAYEADPQGPPPWRVGYYDPSLKVQAPPLVFDDRVRACAEYVIRAVRDMADRAERRSRERRDGSLQSRDRE